MGSQETQIPTAYACAVCDATYAGGVSHVNFFNAEREVYTGK